MINNKKWFASLIMLVISALSCNLFSAGSNAVATETAAAQTVAALVNQTLEPALNTTQVSGTLIAQFTQTALAQAAAISPTATTTPTPSETAIQTPCNWAGYVTDVSYPDGSTVSPGQSFVKTWRMQNLGTCTWSSAYKIIYDSGEKMNAPDAAALTNTSVPPGGTVDVSVSLKAPASSGSYQTNFRMKAPDGTIFGIGSQANGSFWARIQVVSEDAAEPAAEAGSVDLNIQSFSVNPTSMLVSLPVTVAFVVKNKGTAASGPFQAAWSSGEAGGPQCSWNIDNLNPGESRGPLTCNYKYKKAGNYNSQMVLDSGNQIAEANEANNADTKGVTVTVIKLVPMPTLIKIPFPGP